MFSALRCVAASLPAGIITDTDVDVAQLAVQHELSPQTVTDLLELCQKACHRGRASEEPFALNFSALQSRVSSIATLGTSPVFTGVGLLHKPSTPTSVSGTIPYHECAILSCCAAAVEPVASLAERAG